MMNRNAVIGFLSFLGAISANGEANPQECSADSNDKTCISTSTRSSAENPTCKFYLAPSSIPNAGFGVYTTEAIAKNAPLTDGSDAPNIIVCDADAHNGGQTRNWHMHNYFWSGEGISQYECASTLEEFVVTFGTSTNFHTYLKNIYPVDGESNDSITPRSGGSPGIGAYSYDGGTVFHAERDIKAGEELFSDYGEEWLDTRPNSTKYVPRQNDFEQAANVILKIIDGMDKEEIDDSFFKSVLDVVKIFNVKAASIFPETAEELKSILNRVKGELDKESIAMEIAFDNLKTKDLDWIVSEGKCLDNLIKKVSTLPDAGRGAFAQRFVPKGETVVIAPLLHIMDDESTYLYQLEFDDKGQIHRDDSTEPYGQQLITNYCFSHHNSSMLMCPQTNAILINHCSARQEFLGDCGTYNQHEDVEMRGANAEIRWAEEWDPNTKSWLKKTMEEIAIEVAESRKGLTLEVVAKRDIHPGDEVFIDYGEGWEIDWNNHVADWAPPSDENYAPLHEMKKLGAFRTTEELEENPYPENVQTVCAYWVETDEIYDTGYEDSTVAEDWTSDGRAFSDAAADFTDISYQLWPCSVLSRQADEDGIDIYEVQIFRSELADQETPVWHVNEYPRILQNYTKSGIEFASNEYATDQYLDDVFRSYLRIPDEMFPEQWKDSE